MLEQPPLCREQVGAVIGGAIARETVCGGIAAKKIDPNPELVRIRIRDFRLISVGVLAVGQVLARVFSRCLPLQRGVGTNLVIVRPPGVDFLLGVGK